MPRIHKKTTKDEVPAYLTDTNLTPKQKQAIPYLVAADKPSHGAKELDDLGIVTWHHFWHEWRTNPYFWKVYIQERNRVQGETAEMLYNMVDEHRAAIIKEEINVALCDETSKFVMHKQRAIEKCLSILGVESTEGTRVDVTINNQIKAKQESFRQLIEESQRERDELLGIGVSRLPNEREDPSDN